MSFQYAGGFLWCTEFYPFTSCPKHLATTLGNVSLGDIHVGSLQLNQQYQFNQYFVADDVIIMLHIFLNI